MSKKKKPKIQYRINEIKRISHFENNARDLGLEKKDVDTGLVRINLEILVNEKNNLVKFKAEVVFFVKTDEKEIDLFGVTTMNKFEIKNMANVFERNNNNKLIIPEDFMKIMLNVIIGNARGILSVSNTNEEYLRIYLPPVNLQTLLQSVEPIKSD